MLIFSLLIFNKLSTAAQDLFQIAPPLWHYKSVFFDKEAVVTMKLVEAGMAIHYTLNGQEPTENDPIYVRPITIKKTGTTLKARIFGAGYRPSQTVKATFFAKGLPIQSISQTPPDPQHGGSGETTLIDGNGGVPYSDNRTWMGFQDTILLKIKLTTAKKVRQIMLHTLKDQGSWIFSPQQVEVYGIKDKSGPLVLIGSQMLDASQEDPFIACLPTLIEVVSPWKTTDIVVKIYPLARMPDWHSGKGKMAWVFIDEVKLY